MLILGLLHLLDEHRVDLIRLSLDILDNGLSLSKALKGLNQLDSLLDGLHDLKGELDDVLIDVLQLLHVHLELLIVVLPTLGVDIEDRVEI